MAAWTTLIYFLFPNQLMTFRRATSPLSHQRGLHSVLGVAPFFPCLNPSPFFRISSPNPTPGSSAPLCGFGVRLPFPGFTFRAPPFFGRGSRFTRGFPVTSNPSFFFFSFPPSGFFGEGFPFGIFSPRTEIRASHMWIFPFTVAALSPLHSSFGQLFLPSSIPGNFFFFFFFQGPHPGIPSSFDQASGLDFTPPAVE